MTTKLEGACQHGTAWDVHCCNCHSGFIFDQNHQCLPSADDWRTAIESALGVEPDIENHTPAWAFELVRTIREIGNAAATLGKRGGIVKSKAKTRAVRENAKKGGWPKGRKRKPVTEVSDTKQNA